MKRINLEKLLSELGWYFLRHGKRHDHWTNGDMIESIARHREIPEVTARKILKRAKLNPGKKE